jgi:hypothetical protein
MHDTKQGRAIVCDKLPACHRDLTGWTIPLRKQVIANRMNDRPSAHVLPPHFSRHDRTHPDILLLA